VQKLKKNKSSITSHIYSIAKSIQESLGYKKDTYNSDEELHEALEILQSGNKEAEKWLLCQYIYHIADIAISKRVTVYSNKEDDEILDFKFNKLNVQIEDVEDVFMILIEMFLHVCHKYNSDISNFRNYCYKTLHYTAIRYY